MQDIKAVQNIVFGLEKICGEAADSSLPKENRTVRTDRTVRFYTDRQ